ncbi:MAG TPA: hypothetical protein VL382_09155, partial [Terriglobales bacterium]|nr:hypothetical protein [Terriglobales bacterium]
MNVRISTLVFDLIDHYRTVAGRARFGDECSRRWRLHLSATFGDKHAHELGTQALREYRARRAAENAAPASVNRELQILRSAFRLAEHAEPPKVGRVPRFLFARENNARRVFATP